MVGDNLNVRSLFGWNRNRILCLNKNSDKMDSKMPINVKSTTVVMLKFYD